MVYLLDWAGLLVRWLHVIAGIAWIGASFYFVWLDNHLEPLTAPERGATGAVGDGGGVTTNGVAGELWAVHGGGFYHSQKYRVAPATLPPKLHWFYWEAYTTWLSGFGLLCLLYFLRAEAYLIDPAVAALTKPMAISIALGTLVGAWLIYDGLCRSPLGRHGRALAAVLAVGVAAEAWGLCHVFGGRGAFMIFGSSLGTLMVANVLFVIIPGQRELVLAKQQGREPDAAPGQRGKQRSVHNTYFTLPVVFVMISNHYAFTYGADYNWVVLIAMSFAGACIRSWFVLRHKPRENSGWVAALPGVLGLLTLGGVVFALAPPARGVAAGALARDGAVARNGAVARDAASEDLRVQHIIVERCTPCHATKPLQAGFAAPPDGLVFEVIDQVRVHSPEVQQQLAMHAMPLGNLTHMTETERATVLAWLKEAHGFGGVRP